MTKHTISARLHIEDENILHLLDSASRGIEYWGSSKLGFESEAKKAMTDEGTIIEDFEGSEEKDEDGEYIPVKHVLNRQKIKKGLTIMAKKYADHFGDFYTGDYDMYTGDLFIQCCLFGEETYC